ncbi:Uridine nucleosidase [Wickerhamiella sorbophila]|uniref:Uridine nucleosidase n=1 Tax=Wickerhamiella sorbophila TaxID=45607 RepID=A0A2T0FC99_9ASCO|nr:Uridine nucleosidase [Wickerhamiella sorbophila]PRT52590.1 Uridine nucleosidase [Wickerhamiella sorbophila]
MIPIWLDCDPGHDDAIALLLACALPYFDLIGVSTVYGNATLENTTNNAMSLLTAYHHVDVQVFPGAEKPLEGFLHVATDIHGSRGLDGTPLLPMAVGVRQPDHTAVAAMAEAIQAHPGELVIVATGPLTNIALLALNYPELIPGIRLLSIMGGSIDMGNWTKWAEFNLWCDAKASKIVLEDPDLGTKTILVPLNVTHTVIATEEVLTTIQRGPHHDKYTMFRQMMYDLLTFFADSYRIKFGFDTGPPVHDVLAVAAVLPLLSQLAANDPLAPATSHDIPGLGAEFYRANLHVTTNGPKQGQIIPERTENRGTYILDKIDPAAVWGLVFTSIGILEGSA